MANRLNYEAYGGQQAKVLLLWVKRRQPISRLSVNVLREVCSYLHGRNCIIGLLDWKITAFDIDTHTFQSASLSMKIPLSCVFCELAAKAIMILGFDSKSVFSLSFPELEFTHLANMHANRGFSGIIRCDSFIYVFGGFIEEKTTLASSERYNVLTGKWYSLPNMLYPKRSFCPVLYKQVIYLPAFLGPNLVELFDLNSLTFAIYCKLPIVNQMSVAAAVGDVIVLVTWSRVDKISLRKKMQPRKVARLSGIPGVTRTRSTPVVVGREVWFMQVDQLWVVRYHVDTRQFHTFNEESRT